MSRPTITVGAWGTDPEGRDSAPEERISIRAGLDNDTRKYSVSDHPSIVRDTRIRVTANIGAARAWRRLERYRAKKLVCRRKPSCGPQGRAIALRVNDYTHALLSGGSTSRAHLIGARGRTAIAPRRMFSRCRACWPPLDRPRLHLREPRRGGIVSLCLISVARRYRRESTSYNRQPTLSRHLFKIK